MALRLRAALVLLVIAASSVTIYQYTTPTAIGATSPSDVPVLGPVAQRLLGGLPGDLGLYFVRFLLASVLLGILPFVASRFAGLGARELGLRLPRWHGVGRPFLVVLGLGIAIGVGGAFDTALAAIYPFSSALVVEIADGAWWLYPMHLLAYVVLYYLPWEFLFRGVLAVLPVGVFRQFAKENGTSSVPVEALLLIASIQIIPSAILHVGHPVTETLGAVVFGVIAAFFAVKTGSVVPGLILHAAVGLSLDTVVIIRAVALGVA